MKNLSDFTNEQLQESIKAVESFTLFLDRKNLSNLHSVLYEQIVQRMCELYGEREEREEKEELLLIKKESETV